MAQLRVDTTSRAALSSLSAVKMAAGGGGGGSRFNGLLTPPDSPLALKAQQLKNKASEVVAVASEDEPKGGREWIRHPVSWSQFKCYVDAQNLEPLGRSLETHTTYETVMEANRKEYGSVAKYLTTHVLPDFIASTTATGFDPHSALVAEDFELHVNDFPYYLGDGVEHWVLWCRKRLSPGFAAPAAAVQAIHAKFGANIEWRYFVNPVAKQSVPQLSHAHVFVKRTW
ncbi:hypothetical protein H4R27_000631 [Coemansia aciculifera]|uniref:Uncharacterized protein n=1 Tax=Coemansia pectinata TaxID=1052879 RepID=A0A9W8H2R2_9FUNG|nr:hypothetical protein GGI19_000880 [Coemansia pectinata]KAJ2875565.1 hypothetical protein GGH93_001513 [Coemansia aciculifera]KAJ2886498.1 hypothetical protein H4R27_000631 [Coemansia aciculifera]